MKTVLIIDDDADCRRVFGAVLNQYGWQVLHAGNGDEGIELARQHRPSVVLCDLLMPRVNGFKVCRELRADATLRQMGIVVTSGRNFEADRRAAIEAGADDFLPKPVEANRLVAALARFDVDDVPPAPEKPLEAPTRISGVPRLKFWGVRGSTPAPGPGTVEYGGNTSCIEIRAKGELIILDAGTGLRLLGRQLAEEFKDQPLNVTILLTHTHWDHIQGLPFFQPVYQPQNRVRILGYEGARNGLSSVLSNQMENPFFPITLRELPANLQIEELKEMKFSVGRVRVESCFANHPGICVGYRLFTGEASIAYFPDNEPQYVANGADSKASLEYAQGQERRIISFLRGVDILIMDTQYDREEYQRHKGWGHACLDDVVALALKSEVKKLFLFHHDPDHDDAKISEMTAYARKLVKAQNGKLQVEAAREGLVIELAGVGQVVR
ncbi:MAG TPA: response regulator [Verrucomicrobiae bacterium]|jgi:phosphoribosyl 1,2-cyclic phosphodiesterase/CheY-like chemotaxis protein|nr:response regulator [Verrucomicrobiae bacterium]